VKIWPGKPYPLGATHDGAGTNFSLFSEVATRVELCLFDERGTQTCVDLPEMIANLDSDCTYDPAILEQLLEHMENGADLVTASPYPVICTPRPGRSSMTGSTAVGVGTGVGLAGRMAWQPLASRMRPAPNSFSPVFPTVTQSST